MIDVHGHIGRVLRDRKEIVDAVDVIRKMDEWGVEKCCILGLSECPEGWYMLSDTEDVLAACARFPERLVPFCLIDPRFGDNGPETDFRGILAEYKERGCRGIGEFIPKLPFDDPRCMNLYRQAGEFRMPVLFDMSIKATYGVLDDPGLPRLERALRECPDTIFIGHGPTFWAEISADVPADVRGGYPKGPVKEGGAVPRLMERYPNLWADLSAMSGYNAITRDEKFGLQFLERFQDKLMFGTDFVARSQTARDVPIVGFMKRLREEKLISETAWNKIASENARRLLNI